MSGGSTVFQSLLLWIGLFGHTPFGRGVPARSVFQSLLLWIGLFGGGPHAARAEPGSFQSLLLWIGLFGNEPMNVEQIKQRFQSLLLWIGLFGVGAAARATPPEKSFNPCCYGSASSAQATRQRPKQQRSFNPCCYGSASSALGIPTGWLQHFVFQSLLLWIGLFGLVTEPWLTIEGKGFQSLLLWIGLFGH